MGTICVKSDARTELSFSRKRSQNLQKTGNTIKTKMDKVQYQRLQIIKQFLTNDNPNAGNILKQDSQQRQIGDFKFIRPLGDGSYGQVLMVKDKKSNNLYAMKIIKKQLIIQRDEILNALSERYILAAMDHPFVVKLHYAFQTKNKIYLIVDLMSGGELFFLLRKNKKFDEQTAKFYAAEILLALEYLHSKKIIYRDLKPQNVLLTSDGHIKLTDFGLSKVCLKKNEVALSVCGTPQYIAPQVLKGKGYTVAADWFSFGSLLYDMLTGKPPFYSRDKQQMMLKIQTQQIPFPQYLSSAAKSLLKSLFEKKEQNRIGFKTGASQLKAHQFFKSVNFDDIYNKKIKPPFQFSKDQESINQHGFAIKFDEFEIEQSFQKQLIEKSKGVNFQGFTYQVQALKDRQESRVQIGQNKSYEDKSCEDEYECRVQQGHELLSNPGIQQFSIAQSSMQRNLQNKYPANQPTGTSLAYSPLENQNIQISPYSPPTQPLATPKQKRSTITLSINNIDASGQKQSQMDDIRKLSEVSEEQQLKEVTQKLEYKTELLQDNISFGGRDIQH